MEYLIINISEHQVTAAKFDISGRSASLGGALTFLLDDKTDLSMVASKIAGGISGSPKLVVCLPPVQFAQRIVELPLTDLRKVRQVLPAHLQGEIALSSEEAVFDALPVADGVYLALWSRHAEVAHAINVFRDAGCEPQIVSSVPFAWQSLPGISPDCVVCDSTALAIIAEGRLSYVRALDGTDLRKQLVTTLSALEMTGTLLPKQLIIFGEQTISLAGSDTFPIEILHAQLPENLVTVFGNESTFLQLAGLYAVARAFHSGILPDFRRNDLTWTAGNILLRRKLFLTVILVIVAIALLFVSKGMQYLTARNDLASLNVSILSIYRDIFPSRTKAVDELAEIKGEIRKLTGAENYGSVLDVLKLLAEAKGTSINGLFEVEVDGRTLLVKGDARSAQSVSDFKSALASQMEMVSISEIKSRPDGTVTFSLSAKLKEGAK